MNHAPVREHSAMCVCGAIFDSPACRSGQGDLAWLAMYCEQVAHDGIMPSRAWFTETAETLRNRLAALPAPAPQGETRLERERNNALMMLRWVDNELDKGGVPTVEDECGELPGALLSQAGRVAKLVESRNLLAAPALPTLSGQALREQAEAYLSRTGSQNLGRLSPDDLVAFVQSLHRPPDAPGVVK